MRIIKLPLTQPERGIFLDTLDIPIMAEYDELCVYDEDFKETKEALEAFISNVKMINEKYEQKRLEALKELYN